MKAIRILAIIFLWLLGLYIACVVVYTLYQVAVEVFRLMQIQ